MLEKTFDPAAVEPRLYQMWEEAGVFAPSDAKDTFSFVIPPPIVTGSLHIGHALNNTLQDVLTRFERMRGKAALWLPGTDHAGIATQMVVERMLAEQGNVGRREQGVRAVAQGGTSLPGQTPGELGPALPDRDLGPGGDPEGDRRGLLSLRLTVCGRLRRARGRAHAAGDHAGRHRRGRAPDRRAL